MLLSVFDEPTPRATGIVNFLKVKRFGIVSGGGKGRRREGRRRKERATGVCLLVTNEVGKSNPRSGEVKTSSPKHIGWVRRKVGM